MKLNQARRFWFIAVATAVATIAILALILPSDREPGLHPVPTEEVALVETAFNEQVRPVAPDPDGLRFKDQRDWPFGKSAQFHFALPRAKGDNEKVVIMVPFMRAPGRLAINSVPLGASEEQDFAGPMFGRFAVEAETPPAAVQTGRNRVDLIQIGRLRAIGSSTFYWADDAAGYRSIERVLAARSTLADAVYYTSIIGFFAACIGFIVGREKRVFAAGGLISSVAFASFYPRIVSEHFQLTNTAWVAAATLGLLCALTIAWRAYKHRDATGAVLLGLAVPSAFASLYAFLFLVFGIVPDSIFAVYFTNSATLPLIAIGLPLLALKTLSQQVDQLRLARDDISRRDRIIAEQDEALHDQIRQKAILEERQRLVRDMHDGIGGQLLSLLLRVRGGSVGIDDVEKEIQDGITDLRLVVDSLDQVGSDLGTALATFRTRTAAQLAATNITFDWHQAISLESQQLGARKTLNLYRILQEAIANSVRHSGADHIEIIVDQDIEADRISITISDNGNGFDTAPTQAGKGLANMRKRAAMLGAELTVESDQEGTRVGITLPPQTKPTARSSPSEPPRK